jgi:hypothetical protein
MCYLDNSKKLSLTLVGRMPDPEASFNVRVDPSGVPFAKDIQNRTIANGGQRWKASTTLLLCIAEAANMIFCLD